MCVTLRSATFEMDVEMDMVKVTSCDAELV